MLLFWRRHSPVSMISSTWLTLASLFRQPHGYRPVHRKPKKDISNKKGGGGKGDVAWEMELYPDRTMCWLNILQRLPCRGGAKAILCERWMDVVMMLGCLLLGQQHGRLLVVCEVGCIILKCWGGVAPWVWDSRRRSRGGSNTKNKIYIYIYMTKRKLQFRQMVLCFSVKHFFFLHQTD